MLVISNHLIGQMPIPDDAVIRINLAWLNSFEEAEELITKSNHKIYLDFPEGRRKPPRPNITMLEAIELSKLPQVLYFAVSNCEDIGTIKSIMDLIDVEFIPKIETRKGVSMMSEMVKIGIKKFMLDKEDLYTDVHANAEDYNKLVDEARTYDNVLELQGVVFC